MTIDRLYYKHVPGFDTEYGVMLHKHGEIHIVPVKGFVVGCFAVRCSPDDVLLGWSESNAGSPGAKVWLVDLIPAKTGVINLSRLDDALVMADELSRFAPEGIERTTSWSEAKTLLENETPKLFEWVVAVARGRHVAGGFRAFRDRQDPYILLVACDLGIPYHEARTLPDIKNRRLEVKKRCFADSMGASLR